MACSGFEIVNDPAAYPWRCSGDHCSHEQIQLFAWRAALESTQLFHSPAQSLIADIARRRYLKFVFIFGALAQMREHRRDTLRPELPRKLLINDDDWSVICEILLAEGAAGDQRNLEGLEVSVVTM
jgi:hypothetical protein